MNTLRSALARRPLLMNVLWFVCIAMALVRVPIDMLTTDLAHALFGVRPPAQSEESSWEST